MKHLSWFFILLSIALFYFSQEPSQDIIPAGKAGDILIDLPPQTWYQAPNTPMRAVCPPNYFGGKDYEFNFYCANVIEAVNNCFGNLFAGHRT